MIMRDGPCKSNQNTQKSLLLENQNLLASGPALSVRLIVSPEIYYSFLFKSFIHTFLPYCSPPNLHSFCFDIIVITKCVQNINYSVFTNNTPMLMC